MAAINFPENPNDEDVFNGYVYDATYAVWNRQSLTLDNLSDVNATGATDGQTIIYDAASGTWIPGEGGSSFEISETAPEGAEAGDVWYNSATGKTYIYYTDVDGSQWVEIASTTMGYLDLDQLNDVNAPTPADGESLVYDSASGNWVNADATVEVYGVNTAATDYFMIPVGGDAARPVTPANGHIRFNTDSGSPEWYSAASDQWVLFKDQPSIPVQYLVVGGGAGGGAIRVGLTQAWSGGGGAGGYRSSVLGEASGSNAGAEASLQLESSTAYSVTVGAGGNVQANGESSTFHSVTSLGGGFGGVSGSSAILANSGGSGGGGAGDTAAYVAGGDGTVGQGFDGGDGFDPPPESGGGGGGAGELGGNGSSNNPSGGSGGDGIASSITGSSVYRAGGGGGGAGVGTGQAPGGLGGGGIGSLPHGSGGTGATSGQANTGGGGGGAASGGSGIVILKYPSSFSLTVDPGLVSVTNIVGDYKVTQFTDGTGDVTFS